MKSSRAKAGDALLSAIEYGLARRTRTVRVSTRKIKAGVPPVLWLQQWLQQHGKRTVTKSWPTVLKASMRIANAVRLQLLSEQMEAILMLVPVSYTHLTLPTILLV